MITLRRLVSSLMLCAALEGRPAFALPGDDGDWSEPFALPLIAIHAAMLPTGKVLLFSAEHGVPGIHGWLLNPVSLALQNVPPPAPWNPDCAGHSFLPDGRLLVAGGTLGFSPTRGPKTAYIFDSFTEQWTRIEDMRSGRWYPSNITLPDGRVITMSGLNDTNGALNTDVELWDSNGTNNWLLLGQKTVPVYPYLHVMPNGLVFRSGPDAQTETYDPINNRWTFVANRNVHGRYEAPSILLPPSADRVMVVGGNNLTGQPSNSAEIIDLSAPTPQWTTIPNMNFRRMEFNAVILPNGKIFVVGGRSDFDDTPTPVLTPEIFDPQSLTWDMVEPHQIPRRYHSTAILLPDARVLVAGGDFQPSGEIYSPPYLFQGSRPVIQSPPSVIRYGESFSVNLTSTTATNRVALIRYSSVTHSVNFDQRYVGLADLTAGSGTYTVNAPATANLAPPGYYMLFVIDQNGVPSVSATVQVVEKAPAALTAAASRQTHPGAGTFDINLPLTGEPGVECRSTSGLYTLVFIFNNNVVSGSASVTGGNGNVSGSPTFAGNTMTVDLSGVTDMQKIAVTLSDVTDTFAQILADTAVSVNMLIGDTTGNKTVNATDVGQTKLQSGMPVTSTNFRTDVTASGSINTTDIGLVKSRSGVSVP